jgi:hypothetical protein
MVRAEKTIRQSGDHPKHRPAADSSQSKVPLGRVAPDITLLAGPPATGWTSIAPSNLPAFIQRWAYAIQRPSGDQTGLRSHSDSRCALSIRSAPPLRLAIQTTASL